MVLSAISDVYREPRAPEPPVWRHRSWLLVSAVLVIEVLVAIFDEEVPWPVVAVTIALTTSLMLRWRHTMPVLAVVVTHAMPVLMNLALIIADVDGTLVPAAGIAAIVAAYALFRWASGREAAIGAAIIVVASLVDVRSPLRGIVIGSVDVLTWVLVAAVAVVFRYRANLRIQMVSEARSSERAQLARELHDTVAHHVSAIAIQAQAGQALAETRPEAAVDVLRTIETAASNTLADMRRMVGALRDSPGDADLVPQAGLAQIGELADSAGVAVTVRMDGDLDGLGDAVEASLYRLTQEAITNARRHAKHATRIDVSIVGRDDVVSLRVADDGDTPGPLSAGSPGFGLVGMRERASLLGGTFEAGPGDVRGWTVEAAIPRSGRESAEPDDGAT